MSAETPNPFEIIFDKVRRIVREELARAAGTNGNDLLSAEAAAKCFDVPTTFITEAARRGELASVKLGDHVRFKPEDLAAFIKANRTKPFES